MQTTLSSPSGDRLEVVAQLQAILAQIAHGAAPFGPPPRGLLRRAHTTDVPELGSVAGDAPPPAWPELPLAAGRSLSGAQVGRAILAIASDEAIAGASTDAGLTPARLRAALQTAGFDPSNVGRAIPALALWLARASVLAPPEDEGRPWAAARPLRVADSTALRDALRATPPPPADEIAAERDRGLR